MTSQERRIFVHRAAWLIIPGLISGSFTAGIAWATLTAELDSIHDRMERIEELVRENNNTIMEHRLFEHGSIRIRKPPAMRAPETGDG